MKTEHMEYIVEVSKCRSINQAAANLFINQQQLSRTIAAVEKELDITIFSRNTKGVIPTKEGEVIIRKFKQILDLYENMQGAGKNHEITGKIHVYSDINVWSSYASFYGNFLTQYPSIRFEAQNMASNDILKIMEESQSGVGFVSLLEINHIPQYHIPDTLDFIPISNRRLEVYGNVHNPYLQQYHSISLSTLRTLPLIQYKPYHSENDWYSQLLFRDGKTANLQYKVNDIRIFYELVENTDCLFMALKKPPYIQNDSVQEITLRDEITLHHGLLKSRKASKSENLFAGYYLDFYKGLYA